MSETTKKVPGLNGFTYMLAGIGGYHLYFHHIALIDLFGAMLGKR